ncbi:hypothetical protein NMY22_g14658 [Coprinellus aureogranulatus]|nr:hypothetical protein NMY22_g14658 [Coprinellus aureogranulatus]
MNEFYAEDKARLLLRGFRQESLATQVARLPPFVKDLNLANVFVSNEECPPSLRLSTFDQEEGGEVDAIIRIQAVLCGKNLGPLVHRPFTKDITNKKALLGKIRSLRQHVKLTALGVEEIEEDFKKLEAVWALFSQYATGKEVPPMDFIAYEGYESIEAHNTRRVHSTAVDNVVEYCQRTMTRDGEIKYEECSPGIFKAGDIVEVAFAIVGIPIKDERLRMMFLLKGLTLLDNELRKESELVPLRMERARIDIDMSRVLASPKRVAKRRPVYLQSSPESSPTKRTRSDVVKGITTGADDAGKEVEAAGGSSDPKVQTAGDVKEEGEVTDEPSGGAVESKSAGGRAKVDAEGYDAETELGQIDDLNIQEKDDGQEDHQMQVDP